MVLNLPLVISTIPALSPPFNLIFPLTFVLARTLSVFLIVVLPPTEPRVNVVAFVARFTVLV